MIITKYYCDHCGNEIVTDSLPVTVVAIGKSMFHVCADCATDLTEFIGTAKHTKPPLGLVPRFIRDEERVQEIIEAVDRYNEAGKPVPQEWLDELNEKAPKEKQNND